MGDTSIDRVADASLSLIGNGDDGLTSVVDGEVREELGDVARAKHLVDGREPCRALLGAEVRREYAV